MLNGKWRGNRVVKSNEKIHLMTKNRSSESDPLLLFVFTSYLKLLIHYNEGSRNLIVVLLLYRFSAVVSSIFKEEPRMNYLDIDNKASQTQNMEIDWWFFDSCKLRNI